MLFFFLQATLILGTPAGYGHKQPPCTTELVPIPSQDCKVEYSKNCVVKPKVVEKVSGYTKGACKQVVNEKCYRKVRGKDLFYSHSWYIKLQL